jgi:hypothetical protein
MCDRQWGSIMLEQASEIWAAIGGFVAGAVGGSLVTLRVTRSNRLHGSGRLVDQSRSKVGGDQIGGNKTHK